MHGDLIEADVDLDGECAERDDEDADELTVLLVLEADDAHEVDDEDNVSLKLLSWRVVNVACWGAGGGMVSWGAGGVGPRLDDDDDDAVVATVAAVAEFMRSMTRFSSSSSSLQPGTTEVDGFGSVGDESGLAMSTALALSWKLTAPEHLALLFCIGFWIELATELDVAVVDAATGVTVAKLSLERSSGISLGITVGADSHTGESGGCGVVDVGFFVVSFFTPPPFSALIDVGNELTSTDVGEDGVLVSADDADVVVDPEERLEELNNGWIEVRNEVDISGGGLTSPDAMLEEDISGVGGGGGGGGGNDEPGDWPPLDAAVIAAPDDDDDDDDFELLW